MPRPSGFALCHFLDTGFSETPVVFLTSQDSIIDHASKLQVLPTFLSKWPIEQVLEIADK